MTVETNEMSAINWEWLPASEYGGVDGGAMSKLFRDRVTLCPTLPFLLAKLSRTPGTLPTGFGRQRENADIPFAVTFRFVDLFGENREAIIQAMDLRGLRSRREEFDTDPVLSGTTLDRLDEPDEPLRVLYVEDHGTHGLYGHPDLKKKSHLFLAMYYIGGSNKDPYAGGSYGFGKSALERSSRIHSVIAHSVFKTQDDPPDPVRTRLVGFTWWPGHEIDNQEFEGRAIFGDKRQGATPDAALRPTPFEDESANAIARTLGFKERDPEDLTDLGTSFLVIDPAIDPEELVSELEKWWWPALQDHSFDIEVITPDDERLIPKPASNPFVAQFLPAYRIALGQDVPSDPDRERLASSDWRRRGDAQDLGDLGLVVPDEPLQEDGTESEGEGIVALMRSPRMVIKYDRHTRRRVALRGAYVASDHANDLLRLTEPSSHESWTTHGSSDVPKEASSTARGV